MGHRPDLLSSLEYRLAALRTLQHWASRHPVLGVELPVVK
jgi:hypothetical protein